MNRELRRCNDNGPMGIEFLRENFHREPMVLFFLQHFKTEVLKFLLHGGIALLVHSVWSVDSRAFLVPPA